MKKVTVGEPTTDEQAKDEANRPVVQRVCKSGSWQTVAACEGTNAVTDADALIVLTNCLIVESVTGGKR